MNTNTAKPPIDRETYLLREVEVAINTLGAQRKDIEHLMSAILPTGASVQQVPGLLKRAYKRLQQMREITAGGDEAIEGNKQLTHLVQKALFAATQLNYEQAAGFYSQVANKGGLSTKQQWHYQTQSALMLTELGREFSDNNALQQAIYLLEDDAIALAAKRSQDLATTLQLLGNVQGVLGQRQGGTRNLENSIASFEASLSHRDRKQHPLAWAETQNSLGNSLGTLAHRQNDLDMLGRSVETFELALEERTKEVVPLDWASTQNNLAAVLQSIGQRNKNPKLLKRAVEIYKEVLLVWTHDLAPQDWATTMNNLGTALRLLGEHRKGPRTFEQSIAAYKSALSERSREMFPQEWAMTQNNLGAALQKLAELEKDGDVLLKAIEAYENTLKEWTREAVPMAWAMAMANLGVARRTLAEVLSDADIARTAVDELEIVSDLFRELSHAHYSELAIDQVAKARKLMDTLH